MFLVNYCHSGKILNVPDLLYFRRGNIFVVKFLIIYILVTNLFLTLHEPNKYIYMLYLDKTLLVCNHCFEDCLHIKGGRYLKKTQTLDIFVNILDFSKFLKESIP